MLSAYVFIAISTLCSKYAAQSIHETDLNFRIEPGSRTCFFEKGKAGQMMEAYYQVLDGQHGDLDITFEITDPNGENIIHDYKKAQNSIIRDLDVDGDYVFCMDNSFSMVNSKLVFVYVMIEDKETIEEVVEVAVEEEDGEHKEEPVLEWEGADDQGNAYYIEVDRIAESLKQTLKHVVKARHMLDVYSAMKSRDSYLAFEETFVVDMWSAFQISVMCVVGLLQVYMIKKLFRRRDQVSDFY